MSSAVLVPAASLIGCALIIYWACKYFVNGIEWLGVRTGISQNAVGTVLAAFGTALPESVVTLVAVVFGPDASSLDIGVGAALGGPLVLATVAYPLVGIMLMLTRRTRPTQLIDVNGLRLARDQGWFLLIFVCKIALGFVLFTGKAWLGWLFLGAYAAYTIVEVNTGGDAFEGEPEPLLFQPRAATPGAFAVWSQTLLALAVTFVASRLFVNQLAELAPGLGIPAAVIALLLTPIATELPEAMNAVIWIRQGKHRLALSNISGSMMVQATVPTALGLFFTPWLFGPVLAWAALLTAASIALMWLLLRCNRLTVRGLAAFIAFYGLFLLGALWIQAQPPNR